ncbi:MAG: hypothetical protein N3E49_02605 [Bacteroidia bacterium]|nr:hypothetical protein [Bacteroidia bacterium]
MRWVGLVVTCLYAQGGVAIGQWGTYAYHGFIRQVGYVPPYFWFLSGEGVCLIDAETGAYRELDRPRGLLYNRPTALYSDPYSAQIFLGYGDGSIQYGTSPENLDLLQDIAANPFYTSRAIRDFCAKGDTLVIATDFGLVVWHKKQRRVLATVTQFPDKPFAQPVKRVWWAVGRLWAFLDEGLYALPEGRPWIGPWEKASRRGIVDTLNFFQGWAEMREGLVIASRQKLYRWADTGWVAYTPAAFLDNRRVFSLCGYGGGWGIAVSDTSEMFFFGSDGQVRKLWNAGPHVLWMSPTASHIAAGTTWIGGFAVSPQIQTGTDAFQRLRDGGVTEILPTPSGLFFLHYGSGFWGPGWGGVITFYPHGAQKGVAFNLNTLIGRTPGGFTQAAWDGQRAWILTSSLLLRLAPEGALDTFTAYNAPFDGLFPNADGRPTLMGFSSIAIDSKGTVWIGKSFGNRNIVWYAPASGRWYSLPRSEMVLSVKIDSRGYKWCLLRGGKILVIDDQGLPEDPTRHRSILLGDGGVPLVGLPSSVIQSIAPDRMGAVWLGTDKGVAVLYGDPFAGSVSVSIPIIENRYLLEEESITDIVVDGQNRKWIGTSGSGVYVISSDGSRQLASYNAQNSPLPSNLIYRIRAWDQTGEIFIITSDGAVSYRDFATTPSESLDTLYIFPNPARRSFEGWVGIRGLSEGSTVRIMTVDGQQVRYLQSFGGQAVWDLRTVQGDKVAPGVYIVGALDQEGRRTAVGKIIVTD